MGNCGAQPMRDFESVDFGDARLNKRLQVAVENLKANAQKSILGAQGNRNNAKAFYRLLGNEKFDMGEMAEASRNATISRMEGTVLLVEDTADVNLNGHKKTEGLGYSSEYVRGLKLHSCIALTPEGLPLGLAGQDYYTRPEAKSTLSSKEKAERPIEEKESNRWLKMLDESTLHIPEDIHVVTICDREGDFYELYAQARELGEDFVIRVTHDRATETDDKVLSQIRRTNAAGQVTVNIPRDTRKNIPARQADMEVAYCSVNVKKPSNLKDANLPDSLAMNIVRITEINTNGKEPIEWILATSLPVNSAEDAMKIVEYYIQRWKIERFHFVLKSGCNAQKIQQRSFEKIKAMLLIYSVIAMYIMAVTYIGRVLPDTTCDVFLSEEEWQILFLMIHKKTKKVPTSPYSMADAVKYLGQLGSYKRAPSDGPPGLKAIWGGLFRLFEFMEYYIGLA